MRGVIHHIDLTVSDPGASAALYDAVLTFMGYERRLPFEWRLHTAQGHTSLQLNAEKNASPHDRYAPGLHHLAWRADSREDVDRFHEMLKSVGADILDAPADYAQYNAGRGYYAVFFSDPDGIKLEFAWTPD